MNKSKDKEPLSPEYLFAEAARLVVNNQRGDVAMLQRNLIISYDEAYELMNQLASADIVGDYNGHDPREVLIKNTKQLRLHLEAIKKR